MKFIQDNIENINKRTTFVTERLQIEMRRDVFQAIVDPVRREIIDMLSKKSLTVNEVAENFDVSRPAISKHIKILEECGIVHIKKKGRERYCSITPSELIPAFMWLDQFKNLWEERLDSFEQYVNQLNKNRENE
jgi:DNA-binding transcriptional ArsR family regulator